VRKIELHQISPEQSRTLGKSMMEKRSSEKKPLPLQVLTEFFTAATHRASAAMSQWTRGQVTLSLDEFKQINLDELEAHIDIGDELLTMAIIGIKGFDDSSLILAFDDTNGRSLAASLLNRAVNTEPVWSKLEESAIMETANILGSAYLNELTRLTNRELWPSPPLLTQDFGLSVLEQVIMAQAMVSDDIVLCKTRFEFDSRHLKWNVFFVPGSDLLEALCAATEVVQ
jgi:chemotaxis protein CheC